MLTLFTFTFAKRRIHSAPEPGHSRLIDPGHDRIKAKQVKYIETGDFESVTNTGTNDDQCNINTGMMIIAYGKNMQNIRILHIDSAYGDKFNVWLVLFVRQM